MGPGTGGQDGIDTGTIRDRPHGVFTCATTHGLAGVLVSVTVPGRFDLPSAAVGGTVGAGGARVDIAGIAVDIGTVIVRVKGPDIKQDDERPLSKICIVIGPIRSGWQPRLVPLKSVQKLQQQIGAPTMYTRIRTAISIEKQIRDGRTEPKRAGNPAMANRKKNKSKWKNGKSPADRVAQDSWNAVTKPVSVVNSVRAASIITEEAAVPVEEAVADVGDNMNSKIRGSSASYYSQSQAHLFNIFGG